MSKWLNNLYKKSELYFALVWICIYCVANSLANPISEIIGINSSAAFIFNLILTITLFMWIKKKGLTKYYGLCSTNAPAGRFLWYIPLILFMSRNLWFGFAINFPAVDTVCYILSMLCVGFLEEVIFRGFLFKALAKDNIKKAIIISSVTFGLGHILNLFNGSGMDMIVNLCQIVGAIACGFLFVIIFYRGDSLIPCIIAHSVNNAVSVFANEAGLTIEKRLLFSSVNMIIVILYMLILCRTLPQKQESRNI
ncbi:MAG: lysostaphin resistance A-like protein [Oscillospiraceae bacterium]